MAMQKEGVSNDAAIKRIWMVDSKGLIVKVIKFSHSFKYPADKGKNVFFMKATTTIYFSWDSNLYFFFEDKKIKWMSDSHVTSGGCEILLGVPALFLLGMST